MNFEDFKSVKVLIIGDIILDHFIYGRSIRISPEAPVLVVNVIRENYMLGGAANVLSNIVSLGGKAHLCGVIGDDEPGRKVLSLINHLGCPTDGIFTVYDRPTIKKSRIIAHSQQVCRVDREKADLITGEKLKPILNFIQHQILSDSPDIIIISDYHKGLINIEFMMFLNEILEQYSIPLVIDPKPNNPGPLCALSDIKHKIMTPNMNEAERMTGISLSCIGKVSSSQMIETLTQTIDTIKDKFSCQHVLLTMAERGMAYQDKKGYLRVIPAVAKEVYDVTGAGDTVVAAMALGIASGMSFREAAVIANIAAGIVIGKIGTAAVTADELRQYAKNH